MEFQISLDEIVIFMLIYGGLYLYAIRTISSKNKLPAYIKTILLVILYGLTSAIIWFTYKAEENHFNDHSGLEPIDYTGQAVFMITCLTIYSIILFVLGIHLNRKSHSKI